MLIQVHAQVERQLDPSVCFLPVNECWEIVFLGPFLTELHDNEFDAEDAAWQRLEEEGEHVLTVWAEEIA